MMKPHLIVMMNKINCNKCNKEIWVFREKEITCRDCIKELTTNEIIAIQE